MLRINQETPLPDFIQKLSIPRDMIRAGINKLLYNRYIQWKRFSDITEERVVGNGEYVVRIFQGSNGLNSKVDPSVRLRIRQYNYDKAFEAPPGYELVGHEMGATPLLIDMSRKPDFVGRDTSGFVDEVNFAIFRKIDPYAKDHKPVSSSGSSKPYEDSRFRSALEAERLRLALLNQKKYDLPNGIAWGHCFSVTMMDSKALPAKAAADSLAEHFEFFINQGYEPIGAGEACYTPAQLSDRDAIHHFSLTFWRRKEGPPDEPDFPIDGTYVDNHLRELQQLDANFRPEYPKQGLITDAGKGVIWDSQCSDIVGIPHNPPEPHEVVKEYLNLLDLRKDPQRVPFPALIARGYEACARKMWRIKESSGLIPEPWHFQLRWENVSIRRALRSEYRLFEIDVGVKNAFGDELHKVRENIYPSFDINESLEFQEAQHDFHEGIQSPNESCSIRRVFLENREPVRMDESTYEAGTSLLGIQEARMFRIAAALERFHDCEPVTFRYMGSFRIPVPIPGITKLPVMRDEVMLVLMKPGAGVVHYGYTGNPISDDARNLAGKKYRFHAFLDSQAIGKKKPEDPGDLQMIEVQRGPDGHLSEFGIFIPKSDIYPAARQLQIIHKKAMQELMANTKLKIINMDGTPRAILLIEIIGGNDDDVNTGEGMRKILGTTQHVISEIDILMEKILGPIKPYRLRIPERNWEDATKIGLGGYDDSLESVNIDSFQHDETMDHLSGHGCSIVADGKFLLVALELYYELDESYLIGRYGYDFPKILENIDPEVFLIPQTKHILSPK